MRRTGITVATIACATAVLAGPANAGTADPFNSQYEGRAPKADTASYIGFDVKKKRGTQRVTKVKTLIPFKCANGGPQNAYLPIFGKGAIKVKPTGKFTGSVKAQFPAALGQIPVRFKKGSKITLTGKLGKGKVVKGSVNSVIKLAPIAPPPPRGVTSLNCFTGKIKFEVKRGADVTPVAPVVTREALGV